MLLHPPPGLDRHRSPPEKLLSTVSTHTLVALLRPACLGGGHLLVLLVLPLRRPFSGGWPLLFLRRGLLAGFLLVLVFLVLPLHQGKTADIFIPKKV